MLMFLLKLFLFPVILAFKIVEFIIKLTGRLIAGGLGFIVIIIGIVFTVTLFGAAIGIPLIILGILMMIKSIF
jgi:hypothetical protein